MVSPVQAQISGDAEVRKCGIADYVLSHPLSPPLQTVRLGNAFNNFVWRGGRIKRGVSPLLTLYWVVGRELRVKPLMMRGWQGGKRFHRKGWGRKRKRGL